MGLIDSINRLNNENISARKRAEIEKQLKKDIENELYIYFNNYFKNTVDPPKIAYFKLLKLKEKNLKSEFLKNLNDYEKNNIYDKILKKVYINYKTLENQTENEIKKELYNNLYIALEKYYIAYGVCAFEMLQDYKQKFEIISNIIKLYEFDSSYIIYLKKEYQKINKLLYNEFLTYKEDENENQKNTFNWSYLLITILKILLFPIFLTLGFGLTYKPKRRK